MGSARINQEAVETAAEARRREELEERERTMLRKHATFESQMSAIRAEIEADLSSLERDRKAELTRTERAEALRRELAQRKKADDVKSNAEPASRKKNGQELRR